MKKTKFLLYLLLLLVVNTFAQEGLIQGTVYGENKVPLEGATVEVTGKFITVITDKQGRFRLKGVLAGDVISIGYVNYKTYHFKITSEKNYEIILESQNAVLDEVVVTGVGRATEKKKVAIAVETITAKDLPPLPSGTIDKALAGRVAGATIQSTSGQPGQQASILLRGINSLSGTQPLILVDGVQINAEGNFNGSNRNTSSRLSDLDLSNVERIEVVQGAAAGTLYGAQGANGVIQIFTKKGNRNDRPLITFSTNWSVDDVLKGKLRMSDRHYFNTDNEGYIQAANGTRLSQNEFGVWGEPSIPSITSNTVINKPFKEKTFKNPGAYFRRAVTSNTNINISGGSKTGDYAVSLSNIGQQSIVFGRLDRTNLSLNLGMELAKNLKLRSSTQIVYSKNGTGGITGNNNVASGISNVFLSRPYIDLTAKNKFGNYVSNPAGDNSVNPFFNFDFRHYTAKTTRVLQGVNLNYTPFRFLEIDYKFGVDYTNYQYEDFIRNQVGFIPTAPQRGSAGIDPINGRILRLLDNQTIQNSLLSVFIKSNLKQDFNLKVPLSATTQLSYDWRRNDFIRNRLQGTGFPNFPPYNMSTAQTKDATDTRTEFITFGYLINQRFDWGNKFGISGGFRSDWASTFGEGRKPFFFPRGDMYINLAELFNLNSFKQLKLRSAYGEAGIQPDVYARQITLTSGNFGNSGFLAVPDELPNPDLKVERSKEFEVGADVAIVSKSGSSRFFSRINLSATYWTRKGTDIIRGLEVSPSGGSLTLLTNGLKLESSGFQFNVNSDLIKLKKFSYNLGITFGSQKTTVTHIANGKDIVLGGSGSGQFVLKQGAAIGSFYGRAPLTQINQKNSKNQLIIPEAAHANHEIVNGMVVNKTSRAVVMTNEQVFLGDPTPKFTLSFLNNISFLERFNLFIQLDWFYGNKVYNQTRQWLYRDLIHGDNSKDVTINGQTGAFAAYYNSLYLTNNTNGYFVEDGSFLRLRDITLNYTLPLKNQQVFKSVQFFISGRNLATITKYTGIDPEAAASFNDPLSRGLDLFNFPNSRSFQAGLTFKL